MTPEEEKQLIEWIKKVENWLGERNASPAVRELVLGDLRNFGRVGRHEQPPSPPTR